VEGWHPAFEEYTEAIFELREDDVEVIQARIAERLDVSRPAVSEMIRRLEDERLVAIESGVIKLTSTGMEIAERTVRRHRIAERFLTDMLGLPWHVAHEEAGKWEHVISDRVEAAMLTALGNPTTCPHGNPIPGAGYVEPDVVQLTAVPVGSHFTVQRIPEALEFADGLLEYLQDANVVPGQDGAVTASSPDGTITVDIAGSTVGIGAYASERILVSV
jgi:DtxR family transcriptional regulator, iron-dependent repressor